MRDLNQPSDLLPIATIMFSRYLDGLRAQFVLTIALLRIRPQQRLDTVPRSKQKNRRNSEIILSYIIVSMKK